MFIALSAGAYAAGLPKNSVKSKQIKDGQVKLADLAAGSVDGSKVIDDSLTGADIQESTLQGVPAPSPDTAAQILAKLLTVDGSGSGLDADLLDGISSAGFLKPGDSAGGALAGTYANPTIAAGAVGSAAVADGQLVAGDTDPSSIQSRVTGACPNDQAVQGVSQDGTVTCEDSVPGPPTGTAGGDLEGTYPNPRVAPNKVFAEGFANPNPEPAEPIGAGFATHVTTAASGSGPIPPLGGPSDFQTLHASAVLSLRNDAAATTEAECHFTAEPANFPILAQQAGFDYRLTLAAGARGTLPLAVRYHLLHGGFGTGYPNVAYHFRVDCRELGPADGLALDHAALVVDRFRIP